jgi:hypothetical protein
MITKSIDFGQCRNEDNSINLLKATFDVLSENNIFLSVEEKISIGNYYNDITTLCKIRSTQIASMIIVNALRFVAKHEV